MSSASIEEALVVTTQPTEDESTKPPLSLKNYLNLIAFVLNVTLVYGLGNAGWLGTPDNGELSRKYQTLITPNSSAFSIWGVIFIFQGAFAVLQMLPRFRAQAMVLDGASYWYSVVCAVQIGWTIAFAYEVIPLSLAFMVLIWLSLVAILYSQYYAKSDGSLWEFLILRFPFSVHAGWITAASALNVNVQVVSMDQPADIQLAVGIVSLAVLHAISVWVLFYVRRPNWTIACVLSWAFGWIYAELRSPNELITSTFASDTINGVRYAAISVSFIILIQIIIRLGLLLKASLNPYKEVNGDTLVNEDQSMKV